MATLRIRKFGPIENCEIDCSRFMVLTGFQASGKSTIAKSFFFFRTIKDDVCTLAEERAIEKFSSEKRSRPFISHLVSNLRQKFLRIFGSTWAMDDEMQLKYSYSDKTYIKITLKKYEANLTPNIIDFTFSDDIRKKIRAFDKILAADKLGIDQTAKQELRKQAHELFSDHNDVVYVPAGRSMLTLLSEQLYYIYTTMKDAQKRSLDYCTQKYIEKILEIKSEFSNGLHGLAEYYGISDQESSAVVSFALELVQKVLRGDYVNSNGEDRIQIKENKYVKINYASSGQQESVWILNLLIYYLLNKTPVLFIIEEPESNLFPESQKYITELITLIANQGHSVLITTHSPYVLGTLNNLLFANQVGEKSPEQAEHVISKRIWLDDKTVHAYFVKNGGAEDCMDSEMHLIQNERIDEISHVVNQEYDQLFDIQLED